MDKYVRELFHGAGCGNDINKAMMAKFEIGKWEDVGTGIRSKKVHEDDKHILFVCQMEKDSSFGRHIHSDMDEDCVVVSGILGDHLSKQVKVRGENMYIPRGVPHHPYAKTNVLFYVTYYK